MRSALVIVGSLVVLNAPCVGGGQPPAPPPAVSGTAVAPNPYPRQIGFQRFLRIETGADFAQAFAFSPNSKTLVIADGQCVRFVDPRTGKEASDPWKFSGIVQFLAFVDAGTLAVVAEPRAAVSVRAYPAGKELACIGLENNQTVACLSAAPGRIAVATDGTAPSLCLFAAPDWRRFWRTATTEKDRPLSLVFAPNRNELVAAGRGAVLQAYATTDGKLLRNSERDILSSPDGAGIRISPDEQQIVFAPVRDRSLTDTFAVALFDSKLESHRLFQWFQRNGSSRPLGCTFTPDGKTLVVPCDGQTVRLYELETGELRATGGTVCNANRFAISPDGRLFACGGAKSNVIVLDWRGTQPGKKDPFTRPELEAMWHDLGAESSERGFGAVITLGAAPDQAAKLIGEHLEPIRAVQPDALKHRIADLASDDFKTREAAEEELAKLGSAIETDLREAVKSDDPERRNRAARLLKLLARRGSTDRLRTLRAVEVLEYIDTPAARDVLKALAGGAPAAHLTQDAKAALARLLALDSKP